LEELPVVSLFGQVWLWSLLSFVAGVLLTWLVLVRPAKRQVGELEDQLARAARPERQQPVAAAPVSSPMRDDEFDDWHVESRSFVDDVLAPEPSRAPELAPEESQWPSQPARSESLPADNQWPSQPGRPEAQRPPEQHWPSQPQPPRPLEQPPLPPEARTAFTPVVPVPETKPEPPRVNDSAPAFEPIRAFDDEPEPEDHDYDELPPALTRIPEPEPPRIVEPVEVPEEEKPRSLFERLPEVQAEPVPLHPAEETSVFQRSDLDELPNLPEIPAEVVEPELPIEQTQFMPVVPAGTAEIAPPQEEPTAPPEVDDFRPREMWHEEEEAQLEPAADVVHEDELLEEDSSEQDVDEAPVVERESAVEETSVFAAADLEQAIAEGDARAAAEAVAAQGAGHPVEGAGRDSAQNIGQAFAQHSGQGSGVVPGEGSGPDSGQKAWSDHDLPGERIASSQGSLGVELDDPDDRRDDPDEEPIAPAAVVTPPPVQPAPPAPAPASAPAGERPRSLFEPVVGETDEDELPKEQPRNLPPSDDQPFVPKLAPSLLERSTSGGLPQRPQRPAGQPPMSPSPLSASKPPPPPAPQPLPARPRPVGFSPTTGGRSDGTTPRYQQAEGFNPRSPFGPGSVLPRSDGLAPAPDFAVKATLTGRRYFTPESANFHETRADVWFRTAADAQKAGFRQAP
jgi:hypothetical protein